MLGFENEVILKLKLTNHSFIRRKRRTLGNFCNFVSLPSSLSSFVKTFGPLSSLIEFVWSLSMLYSTFSPQCFGRPSEVFCFQTHDSYFVWKSFTYHKPLYDLENILRQSLIKGYDCNLNFVVVFFNQRESCGP